MTKAVIYKQDGHTFFDMYLVDNLHKDQRYNSYYAKNDEVLRILLDDIKPDIVEDLR